MTRRGGGRVEAARGGCRRGRMSDREEGRAAEAGPPGPGPGDLPATALEEARRFAAAHGEVVGLGVPSLVWGPGQARRLRLIEERIPLAGRRVLDVGCGVGQYVRALQALPATAYGVDVERGRVSQGARRVEGLLVAAGEALPFRAGAFDVVLLNEVLEHVGGRAGHAGGGGAGAAGRRASGDLRAEPGFSFRDARDRLAGAVPFRQLPVGELSARPAAGAAGAACARLQRPGAAPVAAGAAAADALLGSGVPGLRRDTVGGHERLGRLLQAALHRAERTPLRVLGLSHFVILERVTGEAEG